MALYGCITFYTSSTHLKLAALNIAVKQKCGPTSKILSYFWIRDLVRVFFTLFFCLTYLISCKDIIVYLKYLEKQYASTKFSPSPNENRLLYRMCLLTRNKRLVNHFTFKRIPGIFSVLSQESCNFTGAINLWGCRTALITSLNNIPLIFQALSLPKNKSFELFFYTQYFKLGSVYSAKQLSEAWNTFVYISFSVFP